MYFYLYGKIVDILEEETIIDVHDVGYSFFHLRKSDFNIGQTCKVYLYHVLREDDEYFVGFKSLKEKEIFMKLINVKGIGPKTAISIFSQVSVDEFVQAINNSNVSFLKKLQGIGPKAAQQIILDLNGKLVETRVNSKFNPKQEEAILALRSLGFKVKEVEDVINKLPETLQVEELIRESLRRLKK